MANKENEGRLKFEEMDHEATAAAVSILKSVARLAEDKPEEFFGLKPSELQILS